MGSLIAFGLMAVLALLVAPVSRRWPTWLREWAARNQMIKRGDTVRVLGNGRALHNRYIVRNVHPARGILQLVSVRKRVDHGLWVPSWRVIKILTLGGP